MKKFKKPKNMTLKDLKEYCEWRNVSTPMRGYSTDCGHFAPKPQKYSVLAMTHCHRCGKKLITPEYRKKQGKELQAKLERSSRKKVLEHFKEKHTTTFQMKQAHPKAVYIVPAESVIEYYIELAKHLNRTDLQIMKGQILVNFAFWKGRTFSEVVIDHRAMDKLTIEHKVHLTAIKEQCTHGVASIFSQFRLYLNKEEANK
jgi:hypothetical protein